ncbi:hypothetical protein EDB83DRAFT_2356985 [Lactarius deliciosus]|nr:hypothetical protein EDB83DRAFT_2356985 [Lactarius deliciosus]
MASPSALNRPSLSHDLEAQAMDSEIPTDMGLDSEDIRLVPISSRSHVWGTGHHDVNVTNSGPTLAQSHDEALVKTWDKNMRRILFFARVLALGLLMFLQLSIPRLAPQHSEADTSASEQPTAGGPTTHPGPTNSDVLVNILWIMGWLFSFSAWGAAGIVQDSTGEYLRAHTKYEDPLTCARVRQYLYEGMVKYHMPVVVKAISALIHITLFLFYFGFFIFIQGYRNTTRGFTATVIISFFVALWFLFAITPSLASAHVSCTDCDPEASK